MSRMPARAIAAARPVILGLTVLNLVYAAVITSLFCTSFFIEGWPWKPLGFDLATMHPQAPLGLRAIMVIGICFAVIVHTVLRRLLAIVETVRSGDTFIPANAQRLNMIAWSVLAIELLRLTIAINFDDFEHLQNDEDLVALHTHPEWSAVVEETKKVYAEKHEKPQE